MSDEFGQTQMIDGCLARLQRGDQTAREELLNLAGDRLMRLTRKIKRTFKVVGRWEQTDDVFQNAALRLYNALKQVEITDARHFFRLAATQIRRELIDLARHYSGPQGMGANHFSVAGAGKEESGGPIPVEPGELTNDPSQLAEWAELHACIARLPDDEREAFDLHYYHGLEQKEAAKIVGISERQFKRRWQSARLKVGESLHGQLPGL